MDHKEHSSAPKDRARSPVRIVHLDGHQPSGKALASTLTPGVLLASGSPRSARPTDILALQRLVGNCAVSGLLQAKRTFGPAGDVRARMGRGLDTDVGGVRLHAGGAQAPGTLAGHRLLAHELPHAVWQTGRVQPRIQRHGPSITTIDNPVGEEAAAVTDFTAIDNPVSEEAAAVADFTAIDNPVGEEAAAVADFTAIDNPVGEEAATAANPGGTAVDAVVAHKTNWQQAAGPLPKDADERVRYVSHGEKRGGVEKGDIVQLSANHEDHVRDAKGNVAWFCIHGRHDHFIRADMVFPMGYTVPEKEKEKGKDRSLLDRLKAGIAAEHKGLNEQDRRRLATAKETAFKMARPVGTVVGTAARPLVMGGARLGKNAAKVIGAGVEKVAQVNELAGETGIAKTDDLLLEWCRKLAGEGARAEARGEELENSERSARQEYRGNIAEGAFWAGASLLGMAGSLAKLTGKDASRWERISAALEFGGSVAGFLGGVTQIIGVTTGKKADRIEQSAPPAEPSALRKVADTSSAIGGWGFAIQEAVGWVLSQLKTFKAGVDLIKSLFDRITRKTRQSTHDWVKQGRELVLGILNTVKGGVRTARSIGEALGKLTVGLGVDKIMTSFAVGIDIALAGIGLIEHVFYLVKSAWRYYRMKEMEKKATVELGEELSKRADNPVTHAPAEGPGITIAPPTFGEFRSHLYDVPGVKLSVDEATALVAYRRAQEAVKKDRDVYKRGAAKVDTLDAMIEQNKARLAGNDKTQQKLMEKWGKLGARTGGFYYMPTAVVRQLPQRAIDWEKERTQKSLDEAVAQKSKLMAKGRTLEQGKTEAASAMGDYAKSAQLQPKRMRKVNLAHELRIVNRKRIVRQAMHISADIMNIVGGSLNLGGITAAAGLTLKGVAGAVEAGLPIARFVKQRVHDQVTRSAALGGTGKVSEVAGALGISETKGSEAKAGARRRQALDILKLTAKLSKHARPVLNARATMAADAGAAYGAEKAKLESDMDDVSTIIKATGVSTSSLYRLNGQPEAQGKLLVEAIKQRELFD